MPASAVALPRPGRRDCQRLHRPARREAYRRNVEQRRGPARGGATRSGPHQGAEDLPVRPDRDDPAAYSAIAQAQRLSRLRPLPRHRPGQDDREHEHRRDAHLLQPLAVHRNHMHRIQECASTRTWPSTCSTASASGEPGSASKSKGANRSSVVLAAKQHRLAGVPRIPSAWTTTTTR